VKGLIGPNNLKPNVNRKENRPVQKDLLSPRELADRWSYNPGSLANMRSEGRGIPFIRKMNGRVYYKLEHVLAHEAQVQSGLVEPA
jgi:hypothetical protein